MRLGDGRQVDELEMHVLPLEHAGLGVLRRERIRAAASAGTRQPIVQQRLAAVRRPDERDLRGTLWSHDQRRSTARPALLRPRDLLVELLDAPLQVGLQVVGALVLRDHAQHLAQVVEPFLRVPRLAERVGGGLVLG